MPNPRKLIIVISTSLTASPGKLEVAPDLGEQKNIWYEMKKNVMMEEKYHLLSFEFRAWGHTFPKR